MRRAVGPKQDAAQVKPCFLEANVMGQLGATFIVL
jgi:hypothetical protein